MVLAKPEILQRIEDGSLVFDPVIGEDRIEQVSVDLQLGTKFTRFKEPSPSYLEYVVMDPSIWRSLDLWEETTEESFLLKPGEFVLAQTLETVKLPPDLMGFVEGRSSYARLGLTIHLTAPKIDPGFHGTITLEMANLGQLPIKLRARTDSPAQLILLTLSSSLEEKDLYGTGKDHIFQYQKEPIPRNNPSNQ